ncbi:MAG: stage II sporulation protein R [Defluviitaleaceae bacterium]|nr:stage II sporulation protein R [Defluviitaleaceae bacterium]
MARRFMVVFCVFMAGFVFTAAMYSNSTQREIAESLIRLHVIAHSDSPVDQAQKFQVKEAVLEVLREYLTGDETVGEAREILERELDRLADIAAKITGHDATAELAQIFFPSRSYGDVTLPAGMYEAVQIHIGDGIGRNWWCVVFPPLCLTRAVMRENLTADDLIFAGSVGIEFNNISVNNLVNNSENVRVRFKVVDIWQNVRNFFSSN